MTFDSITRIGWRTVEVALMAVAFCILAHILLGEASGSFVHSVALNAIQFSQDVPSGTLVGFGLIAFVYWYMKARRA